MKTMHIQLPQNHDKFSLIMTTITAVFAWVVNGIIHPVLVSIKPVDPGIISWAQIISLSLASVVSLIAIYKFFKYKKNG